MRTSGLSTQAFRKKGLPDYRPFVIVDGLMKRDIYKDEGYRLMGAAFEVYNEQGYGLAEEIYQETLEIELGMRDIPFRAKQELRCYYKGRELKKRYVPDLFVSDCLVVELKAVSGLQPEHEAQVINYMRVAKLSVGYLINFGHKNTLEWKRLILSEFASEEIGAN